MRRVSRSAVVFVLASLAVGCTAPAGSQQPPEAGPVHYVYDELSRLRGVIADGRQAASYSYDQVGNIVGIDRFPATELSVIAVTPGRGGVGDEVVVQGTGFADEAGDNAVEFAGSAATVTEATANELTVTVPEGATTGPVTVTTAAGTATSDDPFTVEPNREPTITGVSPTVVGIGDPVTITGTNFFGDVALDTVTINGGYAAATSSTRTQVELVAPPSATSGRIAVTTPEGTARASEDLFVAPEPFAASDVESTARVEVGGSTEVTISTPERIGLVVFDGEAGQRVSVSVTDDRFPSCSPTLQLLAPGGAQLGRLTCSVESLNLLEPVTLPADGTYTVLVDPDTATGSATINVHDVEDVNGTITAGGDPVTVELGTPGQNAVLEFEATEGQRVSVRASDDTFASCSPDVRVFGPVGNLLGESTCVLPSLDFIDTMAIPADGTYRIEIDPPASTTGSLTLHLYDLPANVSESIVPGGDPVTVELATPGQNAELTFEGTAEQRVSLQMSDETFDSCSPDVTILGPDGQEVGGTTCVLPSLLFVDTMTLPADGEYRIVVDPAGATTGSITLRLHDVPVPTPAPIVVGGDPVTVELGTPGQNGVLTFDGTAGRRVAVEMSDETFDSCSPDVTILGPDGQEVGGSTCVLPSLLFVDTMTLPADGEYRIVVDPAGATTGSITLRLHDVPPDVTRPIAVGGAPVAVDIGTPGQNGVLTFDGTEGQSLTVRLSGDTFGSCSPAVRVVNPDGTELTSLSCVQGTGTLAVGPLPATGGYRIVVDPDRATTGAVTVALTAGGAAPEPEASPGAAESGGNAGGDGQAAPGPATGSPTVQLASLRTNGPAASPAGRYEPRARTRGGEPAEIHEPALLEPDDGTTSVSGRVVRLDGSPLAGVTLSVAGQGTRSDETGRFVLELDGVRSGTHVLGVDGRSTNRPGATYGTFESTIEIREGFPTYLDHTIWMPELDTEHTVEIDYPLTDDLVVTKPRILGLELHIPAGSEITDDRGEPITEIGITPIPVDRTPFPLPEGTDVPVYFTIQPGGAYIGPEGARLVYPNYNDEPAGSWVSFLQYCPEAGEGWDSREQCPEPGWHVYGRGSVTADGAQVRPDPGVEIYELAGAMINSPGYSPPDEGPSPGDGSEDGDPVDLGTGLFVYEKTDLVVSDLLPIPLTRTYRQDDPAVRSFGVGTTWAYDLYMWSARQYQEADLILADGTRVHYDRVSAGTGFTDAVFEDTGSPTIFNNSRMAWNGQGWDLTLTDGTTFVFGDEAPLQAIRDRHGNQITVHRQSRNVYGSETGNIVSIQSPTGRWLGFTYDDANRVVEARDHAGRAVTYGYDDGGRLASVTDPAGGVTRYTYDDAHRMRTITDPRGITFLTNEYDGEGRVSRQTQADGSAYAFAYTADAGGRITETQVTGPDGTVRRVGFADGYRMTDTRAVGTPQERSVTLERAAGTHLVTAVTDELGRRTTYGYAETGDLTSVTSLAGTDDEVTTSYTYEPEHHQLATATDQLGRTTRYAYDTDGNVDSVTDPTGVRTTFEHDERGRLASVRGPHGETTTYEYTTLSRVTETDPLGHETSQFLDSGGRPVLFVDALGNRSTVAYDGLNRVLRTTDASGAETSFAYDPNGNLTSLTDARGNATTYTYDRMDRVEGATDPLGATDSYAYDAAGNLVRHTDRRGVVSTFGYDPLGRQVRAAYGTESTVTSSYDGGDRLVRIDDSAYGAVGLTYDALDRLTRRTTPQGDVAYAYDDAGQRTSMTVGGAETTYAYDDAGRLTSIERGDTRVAVTRDAAGRVTRAALPNGVTTGYAYDDAGRVTAIEHAAGDGALGDLGYRYDPLGRRVDVTGSLAQTVMPTAVPSATYDAGNRLTAWGSTAFTYDAAGNLTGDGTDTYTWNARGQLAAIEGGTRAGFTYDPFGRRATRTVAGTTTTYLYDGINVLRETVDGGSPVTYLTGLSADDVLARIDADGTTSYLTDGLGSVVGLVDQAGRLATEYGYGAFGTTESSGDRPDDPNPFRFTGREDDGTGLYYYRSRYYRPDVGRFIAEDPIGFAAGDPNVYAYVSNSPTNSVDPSGLCAVDAILDVAFLAYDAYALFRDGRKNLGENLLAAAADLGGLLIPCASGGGAAVRAGRAADNAFDAASAGRHADGAAAGARGGSRAPCSFDGDTEVLMADGSTKPIEDVEVGDRIQAADPETGERGSRRVTAVHPHEDRLVDLEVEGGGRVTTTEDHPFWNATDGRWQESQDLDRGDELVTAGGDAVRVEGLDLSSGGRDTAYDLTVDGLHSYYVSVGDDQVLVHNCPVRYPPDRPTPNTNKWSASYGSEREARNTARQMLGRNPVEVGPNKWRSQDGRWQYRAKPGDVADNHVHLEQLDPETGDVLQNVHLRW